MKWLKDSSGNPSATLTFSSIAFSVAMLKVLAAGIALNIMNQKITFSDADPTLITSLLVPTFGSYLFRRWSRKITDEPDDNEQVPDVEQKKGK